MFDITLEMFGLDCLDFGFWLYWLRFCLFVYLSIVVMGLWVG